MTYLVHEMGHLAIETPHLAAVVDEAQNVLGLRVFEQDDDRAVLTSNARRAEITYVRAERSALRSVGLEAYDRDAVAEALRRVRAEGLHVVSEAPTAPGAEWGFSFRGPFGHVIEVHTAVPRDQPAEYATEGVRPKRLDHVNMLAEDPVRMRDILVRVLGMRLSDRSDGDEFQFLRAGDQMHHTIALIKGPSALHHFSLEAAQLVDLCRLADRLRLAGRTLLWGPGHHGANA